MTRKKFLFLVLSWSCLEQASRGDTYDLYLVADNSSAFYEYDLNAFYKMNLFSPSPNQTKQSFRSIDQPDTILDPTFDGFPNDRNLRIGNLTYDNSKLVRGTGIAPITGLLLNVTRDPDDATYINSARWSDSTTTEIERFAGSVSINAGAVTRVQLTSDVRVTVHDIGGSTIPAVYTGSFVVAGSQFELNVTGSPEIDAFGQLPPRPYRLEWDFSGRLAGAFGVLGDFNDNGILDAADVDLLSEEVRAGSNELAFDLNDDHFVDQADREVWVRELRYTYFGDANLDHEFDTADLVQVLAEGKYRTADSAGWAQGDWDGNGLFDSSDLVVALAEGGYETGPRSATAMVAAIPEPSAPLTVLMSGAALLTRRRRSTRLQRGC